MSKNETDGHLAEAVAGLACEVQTLRNAIDELTQAIQWGTRNDKFGATASVVAEFVAEAVRDETAVIRDALDEFSLDAQHVARTMREAAATIQMRLFDPAKEQTA